MAEVSFIEQMLDPVAAPPPAEWLWPCLLLGALVSALGVVAIVKLLRGLGPPTGGLEPRIGLLAIGLGMGALVLPSLVAPVLNAPLLQGAASLLITVAAMMILALVQAGGPDESRPSWLYIEPRAMLRAFAVWVVLVPSLLACILASVAAVRLAGGDVTPQPQLQAVADGSGPMWVAGWYVLAACAAPLTEEFAFRLALYGALAGWLARGPGWRDPGRVAAVAVAAGLFVAVHGDWVIGFAPLSLLAWALIAVFAHTRSLWPCVLVHALHNALVLTVQFFVLPG
jgi:membrane protease YdiL (CAAX protease family)